MDDQRFDGIAKLIGRAGSRRSVLKALVGLGGLAVVHRDAEAARRGYSGPPVPEPPKPPDENCPGFACNDVCCERPCDSWGNCCPAGNIVCDGECCPRQQTECCLGVCCNGNCFDGVFCCPEGMGPCPGGSGCCVILGPRVGPR
jgi:hypothetical protein